MKQDDVLYCEALLRKVGQRLFAEFAQEPACTSKQAMNERFHALNPQAEELLRHGLAERFPAYRWSDAEFDASLQKQPEYSTPYWICDAIDGAVYFLQGMPMWAVSLCLVRDGQTAVSFVYDPCRDEMFTAIARQGAFLNGSKISVSAKTALSESVLGTLFAFSEPMNLSVGKLTADSLLFLLLPLPKTAHLHEIAAHFVIAPAAYPIAAFIVKHPSAVLVVANLDALHVLRKQQRGKGSRDAGHHQLPAAGGADQLLLIPALLARRDDANVKRRLRERLIQLLQFLLPQRFPAHDPLQQTAHIFAQTQQRHCTRLINRQWGVQSVFPQKLLQPFLLRQPIFPAARPAPIAPITV